MTMKINLLAIDARNNQKREDAKMFVLCIAGMLTGGVVAGIVAIIA